MLLRLALAPFTAWSPDFAPWLARVQEMAHGVPLYQNLTFSYPPLFAYTLALFSGPVTFLLGADHLSTHVAEFQRLSLDSQLIATEIPHPLFVLATKLPMILADLGTGLLLAAMTRELTGSRGRAELAAAVWFFNPLSIWVGSVHGQFDSIPAFLTVLALSLMWRRQWLGVGVALSLGVLFKLYPIYLLPVAAVFALTEEPWRSPTKRGLRRPIRNHVLRSIATRASRRPALETEAPGWAINVAGVDVLSELFVGVLLPMALYLPALARSSLATAIFSRTETKIVGTGLDLWFPTILPAIQPAMTPLARAYGEVLQLVLYGGLALVAWRAVRGADRAFAQLEAFIGVLLLVLLTSPSTNPQFMVWVLPFVILAWVVRRGPVRAYGIVLLVLSTMPVLFYLALWGGNPLPLLAPAIAYFSWPTTPAEAAAALSRSLAVVGPQNIPLRFWMMFLVAFTIVVGLLAGLVPALAVGRKAVADPDGHPQWRELRMPLMAILLSIAAILLAGLGVTATVQGRYRGPRATATVAPDGQGAIVRVAAGSGSVALNLVAGPAAQSRPVYVLVDAQYPTLLTSFQSVKGLYDHLAIDLPGGGYSGPVSRVTAAEMAAEMRRTPDSVVVVGSGMPDTVLGPKRDFAPVKDFLNRGGELVFAGDGLFYWAARQGQQSFSLGDRQSRIDWAGARAVLGYDLVHDPAGDPSGEILGDSPSPTAHALDISNRPAQRGARLSVLPTVGGWDAGVDTTRAPFSQRTSLAVVPVGAGRLVLFGGGLEGSEGAVANDVTKILLSGTDIGPPLGTASMVLAANAHQSVRIPLKSAGRAGGLRLLAFAPNGFDYYHQSLVVPHPAPSATSSP